MAYNEVTEAGIALAFKEFDEYGFTPAAKHALCIKYGGGCSTKWCVENNGRHYDQKLLLRIAHELQGLGKLPSGAGTFKANQATRHLKNLGYSVVDCSN